MAAGALIGPALSTGQGSSLGGGTSGVDNTISTATGQKVFNTGIAPRAGVQTWIVGGVIAAGLIAFALMARK